MSKNLGQTQTKPSLMSTSMIDESWSQDGNSGQDVLSQKKKNQVLSGVACDVERLERLRVALNAINQEPKFFDVIKVVLETLPTIINCSSASLFILKHAAYSFISSDLTLQKTVLDG